jgi:hypothetical protein
VSAQPASQSRAADGARRDSSSTRPKDERARIPEAVILNLHKVSPAAGQLYLWYCARRNHETGGWLCPVPKAAAALGMSLSRAYEARKELLGFRHMRGTGKKERWELTATPWIAVEADDFTRPLFGFDALEDSSIQVENSSAAVENSIDLVENSSTRIDKDRARGFTVHLPSQTKESASPPAQQARARRRGAKARAPDPRDKSDHSGAMAYLRERCGPVPDGAAQGKAIKWLLSHYTLEQCRACLDDLLGQGWRDHRVSWLTVQKEIGVWLARREKQDASDGRSESRGGRDHAQARGRQPTSYERLIDDLAATDPADVFPAGGSARAAA